VYFLCTYHLTPSCVRTKNADTGYALDTVLCRIEYSLCRCDRVDTEDVQRL